MIQTTIRLPEKLYENLKQEAKKRGMAFLIYDKNSKKLEFDIKVRENDFLLN